MSDYKSKLTDVLVSAESLAKTDASKQKERKKHENIALLRDCPDATPENTSNIWSGF